MFPSQFKTTTTWYQQITYINTFGRIVYYTIHTPAIKISYYNENYDISFLKVDAVGVFG